MTLPKVSCLCPTFARTALLEEAIESFLRQDYQGESELIVCNDFLPQVLQFNHPKVQVINLPERTPNLGAKRNATAKYATGEFLMTWGDDDVHLASRISRMVEFVTREAVPFALEGHHFCLYAGKMKSDPRATAGAHIISRDLYYEIGQIPELSFGEDVAFNEALKARIGPWKHCDSPPQFIYRFTSGRPHVSAFGPKELDPYGRMLILAEECVRNGKEPSGEVVLQPQWRQDWVALTQGL
jgi:glycosyltransferase involved in cell wall biosynthesis